MALVNNLNTQNQPLSFTIGQLTLNADDYDLQVKRPVAKHTLIDGSYHETVLGVLPCSLNLSGRFLPSDIPLLQQTLRTALTEHSLFDFELDALSFSDMAVTEYHIIHPANERFCKFSIVLCGVHCGEVTDP